MASAPSPLAFDELLKNPPTTVEAMRGLLDTLGGMLNSDLPEVGALHEDVAVAPGVTADVVVPRGEGPFPVLVYLHGGGWICGSPRSHRKLAMRFAEAGLLVINVDYRLAPEHPFPTPFEDCLAAVRFAKREASRWRGDAERLAVGGDSAGGNLSAAVAAALAVDEARPRAALLLYGVFDFLTLGARRAAGAADPLAALGSEMIDMMVGAYLGSDPAALLQDPRVSPIRVAERLPPCHVMVGGADPLVAQAEALVGELERAGVEHEHFVDPDMPHGYAQIEVLPAARPAIDRMVEFLRRRLPSDGATV